MAWVQNTVTKNRQEGLKPKYDPSLKVERHRQGKAPQFQQKSEEIQLKKQPVNQKCIEVQSVVQLPFSSKPSELVQQYEESDDYLSEEYASSEEEQIVYKPTFVSKDKRQIISNLEQQETGQEVDDQNNERSIKVRQENIQQAIQSAMQREKLYMEQEEESEVDDEEEYQKWKIREIERIIRDQKERDQRQEELAEIERRRNMEDWERIEEDQRLGNDESAKPQQRKILYYQKYYHKGAFFQERDENGYLNPIFRRDYNTPVEGDFDKQYLPKSIKVRRGQEGKKGRSKWKDLVSEDTTDFNPAFKPDENLALKQQLRQGGYKSINKFR